MSYVGQSHAVREKHKNMLFNCLLISFFLVPLLLENKKNLNVFKLYITTKPPEKNCIHWKVVFVVAPKNLSTNYENFVFLLQAKVGWQKK